MARQRTVYIVEINVEDGLVNENAKRMVPDMIRQFATDLKLRMALVSGAGAVEMDAYVEQYGKTYTDRQAFNIHPAEETQDGEVSE